MKIRLKIFSGFLILACMLIIAGTFSIIEFSKIGGSVKALLDDNYKTIASAKEMMEALEREDSGILLLLLGHWKQGSATIDAADKTFVKALQVAQNNITEDNEEKHIELILKAYEEYQRICEQPIAGTPFEGDITWYFEYAHTPFLKVKAAVEGLMVLNQNSMYGEASVLKEKAQRAIMPGIVAVISALVFSILFNFFINYYFITPLSRLRKRIESYHATEYFTTEIETNDELRKLEIAIRDLIAHLKTK